MIKQPFTHFSCSKGKEAVVLHADGGDVAEATNNTKTGLRGNKNDFEFFPSDIPKELAIKVLMNSFINSSFKSHLIVFRFTKQL